MSSATPTAPAGFTDMVQGAPMRRTTRGSTGSLCNTPAPMVYKEQVVLRYIKPLLHRGWPGGEAFDPDSSQIRDGQEI
jgi:hypothetical protein